MSDEFDPGLRRLFAETAEAPADEAFVAAVTKRTSRERRFMMVARPLAAGLVLAMILAVLATGLGLALRLSQGAIMALVTSSPLGWIAGLALAFAGLVVVRTVGPLVRLTPR
jgi:hypothetical protein